VSAAPPALAAAFDLFNRGRYLAAHEVLDDLWEGTEGEAADFYKGLIQASICLHHWQEGNPDGARKLFAGHRRCLAAYVPRYRGVDVAGFLGAMQRALAPLLAAPPGQEPPPDPAAMPRLAIETGAG
jgi:predicted metal-dependent hydrolase